MSIEREERAFQIGFKDSALRLLVLYGFETDAKILFLEKYYDELVQIGEGNAIGELENLERKMLAGTRKSRKTEEFYYDKI